MNMMLTEENGVYQFDCRERVHTEDGNAACFAGKNRCIRGDQNDEYSAEAACLYI